MVVTSIVPGTRFSSASTACATRSSSKAPRSGSRVHSVSATIGTSSMPLGTTTGVSVPTSRGNQFWLALSTSYSRTRASVRGTPTLNSTVTTARPGRATEYVCSMPAICASTCSAGRATMFCTSALLAPGKAISTLAMVTLICGSSSRGVTSTAKTPSSSATSASSGVSAFDWKARARRPETPRTGVVSAPAGAGCSLIAGSLTARPARRRPARHAPGRAQRAHRASGRPALRCHLPAWRPGARPSCRRTRPWRKGSLPRTAR